MSLDVYLTLKGTSTEKGSGIFVREDGKIKEISRQEWDEKFPDKEPVVMVQDDDPGEVFWYNITHNLANMAHKAGIYKYLWRPEEINVTKASQLIKPLSKGLKKLRDDPEYFKTFNPSNGWGNYEGLVEFVEAYLKACQEWSNAIINVSK